MYGNFTVIFWYLFIYLFIYLFVSLFIYCVKAAQNTGFFYNHAIVC